MTITVKDIIRWKSFRDIVEDDKAPPSDLPPSPHHCTTTTTRSTSTTPRSGSSWCDSDFNSDYLPSWNGNFDECVENEVGAGKKFLPCVGEDSLEATTEARTYTKVGPKVRLYSVSHLYKNLRVCCFYLTSGENVSFSGSCFNFVGFLRSM